MNKKYTVKIKKILAILLVNILIIGCAFALSSCSNENNEETPVFASESEELPPNFEVICPVENICADSEWENNRTFQMCTVLDKPSGRLYNVFIGSSLSVELIVDDDGKPMTLEQYKLKAEIN